MAGLLQRYGAQVSFELGWQDSDLKPAALSFQVSQPPQFWFGVDDSVLSPPPSPQVVSCDPS